MGYYVIVYLYPVLVVSGLKKLKPPQTKERIINVVLNNKRNTLRQYRKTVMI